MEKLITCKYCGQKLRIKSDKEGWATCPKCKNTFSVNSGSSVSGMFDDYIKKNQEEKANAVDLEKLNLDKEAVKAHLKQSLIPYIRTALSQLPEALKQLDYKGFEYREEYTTGTIFKQKHGMYYKAWQLCRISSYYDGYRYYASEISITETGKYVTSLKRCYQSYYQGVEVPSEGTVVSASVAEDIIADEMITSIDVLRSYKRTLEGKIKDGPVQSKEDYRNRLQSITVIGKIDRQDYNGAVKEYFEHILYALSGKATVHHPGELED